MSLILLFPLPIVLILHELKHFPKPIVWATVLNKEGGSNETSRFRILCGEWGALILKYALFLSLILLLTPQLALAKKAKQAAVVSATPTPAPTVESNIRSGLSVGVGWPYLGLKYFFNNDFGAEFRFATGQGINVWAGRGYWRFARSGDFRFVAGLEAGYVTFNSLNVDNTMVVTGTGYEFSPFCGVEYFFARQLSFLFDFSMPYIGLNSGNAAVEDLQWVINGGVYVYPF